MTYLISENTTYQIYLAKERPSDLYIQSLVRQKAMLIAIASLVVNVRPTVLNVFSLITHYGSPAGCGGE